MLPNTIHKTTTLQKCVLAFHRTIRVRTILHVVALYTCMYGKYLSSTVGIVRGKAMVDDERARMGGMR